jgi:hypothetical protein
MRLTIVPSDGIVVIDGKPQRVDCSGIAALAGVHAVQWDGKQGHVEYVNESGREFKSNKTIASISSFQEVVTRWTAAAKKVADDDEDNTVYVRESSDHKRRADPS